MKRVVSILLVLTFVSFTSMVSTSCKCCKANKKAETTSTTEPYTEGVVKRLTSLIGSCAWVIQSTDGKQYETRDVPPEFFVDGLKVKFKFTVIEGLMSKCQTGTIIRVTEIKKL